MSQLPTIRPDEPADLALLMALAGESFQLSGWDDMAERCYRAAQDIKQGATR